MGRRSLYTVAERQSAAQLAHRIGISEAAEQLGIAYYLIVRWARRFPPRLGHCTCKKAIPDAEAWARHNQTIVTHPSNHRLIRTAS